MIPEEIAKKALDKLKVYGVKLNEAEHEEALNWLKTQILEYGEQHIHQSNMLLVEKYKASIQDLEKLIEKRPSSAHVDFRISTRQQIRTLRLVLNDLDPEGGHIS